MSRVKIPDFLIRWIIDHTRWFGIAIIGAILVLGYVTILSGKIQSVRTDGLLRRAEAEKQLVADTAYRDALATSATNFDQKISEADRATIEEFIPTGSDFPSILLVVNDMVERSGLDLSDINVTEVGQTIAAGNQEPSTTAQSETAIAQAATVAGVNLRTQDVTVTINGIRSYEDVKAFVKVIESSRRLFDVIAINFNLAENVTTTEGGLSSGSPITFSLRTYYLPTLN